MKSFKEYYNEQTWNGGFTNIFMPNLSPKERHRKAIVKDPRFRKHAQTVPDMHRSDPTDISKVEMLKRIPSGRKQLTPMDVSKIQKKYNLKDLSPSNSRTLGNTGIQIKFDPNTGSYFLEKY